MARVYVATTLADLRRYHADGSLPSGTDRVVAPAEDEDTEYAALMSAAALSAAAQPAGARRVVVVAAVDDPDGAIAWSDVVAVHADPAERAPHADPDEDLAWYATQEAPDLLG